MTQRTAERGGCPRRARQRLGTAESGVLFEHGPLEASERRAGFDTEFRDQRATSVAVCGERVGLAPRAVQREHLLAAQPFAQRMRGDERIELGEHVDVPAAGKVGLDPVLQRRQPAFLEALHMLADGRLVRQIDQRRPPPQVQRLAQQGRGAIRIPRREARAAARHQLVESRDVELVVGHAQHIALRVRHELPVP